MIRNIHMSDCKNQNHSYEYKNSKSGCWKPSYDKIYNESFPGDTQEAPILVGSPHRFIEGIFIDSPQRGFLGGLWKTPVDR